MRGEEIKGYVLAAAAAAAYGTNPAFAIPLYGDGMDANSVLFFRYALGVPLILAVILFRGQPLLLSRRQLVPVMILGILMAVSSLTLFESYNFINSGVASTLLFVYPIMVAVIMILFYGEKFRASTVICLALMGAGMVMLMKGGPGETISAAGVILVMLSALTYAVYIVMTNVSPAIRSLPTSTLLLYVLLWGTVLYGVLMAAGDGVTMPSHSVGWINLGALALIPTVVSLVCTTLAIKYIGSTPTAILGALEPVTAVVLSVAVLHQSLSVADIAGGVLILAAATMVVASNHVERALLRVRKLFPRK